MNDILVSICCITYNHEKYIRETLDGFFNQKTNFNFEVVISNDCSTDSTQEIIDEYKIKYPNLIRDISPVNNLGSLQNYYYALSSCKGKYIAYCEGDDYWCDNNKLQSQVDFLENNPEYGLVYTKARKYVQKLKKFVSSGGYQVDFDYLLMSGNPIGALSTCYRRELYEKYINNIHPDIRNWKMGDYPLWLYISYFSKIKFLNQKSCVYRILENSASHFTDIDKYIQFRKSIFDVKSFYINYFNINKQITWDESIYYIPLHFNEGHRKLILNYSKPINGTKNKIRVIIAKYSILFDLVVLFIKLKQKLLPKY